MPQALSFQQVDVFSSAATQGNPLAVVIGADNYRDVSGAYTKWFESLDAKAVLIRPDFQVFGVASSSHQVDAMVMALARLLAMNNMNSLLCGITLTILLDTTALANDIAVGKMIFRQCATCHSIEPAVKKIGPSLRGVVNRPVASVAGFTYSADMAALKKNWDMATLDLFMTDPRAMLPGTYMATAGIKKAQDRQALLAYLATLQ